MNKIPVQKYDEVVNEALRKSGYDYFLSSEVEQKFIRFLQKAPGNMKSS